MPRDDVSALAAGARSSAAAADSDLSEDRFLGGRLNILQPAKGYRAGIDAVFLAATVPCRPGETVFEAGIGTGVAALCLLSRVAGVDVTGIELAGRSVELAQENARRNGFSGQVQIMLCEIADASRMLAPDSFAHAFANPPYFESGKVRPSSDEHKAIANAQPPGDLELWVKVLVRLVRPQGTVTLVHRAEALGRLLKAFEGRLGDIRIAPLHPRHGKPASRLIVQGVKGSRAPLQLLPGMILHGEGSAFTPEAEAILRHGTAWPLR